MKKNFNKELANFMTFLFRLDYLTIDDFFRLKLTLKFLSSPVLLSFFK